jgi:ankyrin repeat protein
MQPDFLKFPISISDAKPRSQHLKTHSTPHGCGQCEKAFALWSDLARHTSAVHRVGQPKFECDFPECKTRFKRKDNLHRHKRRYHGSYRTLDGPVSDIELEILSFETSEPRSRFDEQTETPSSLPTLFRAASDGNVAIVELAWKSGLDFNWEGEDGCTVLHVAARAGRDTMVRKLFELGCSATVTNSFKHTPLQEAILSHDEKTVATCLQYCVHTIDAQTLRMALESKNPTIAQLLYRHIAEIQEEVSMSTALYLTVKLGRLDVMEGLLQTSATHVDEVVFRGHNLLHTAAKYGHKEIIMALLARNIPVNRGTSERKTTALHFAIRHGHVEATRLLLQHKDINPNVELYLYFAHTPLAMASHQGHIAIAKLLLSHKNIDPNIKALNDVTPLHHASRGGFTEIVKLLLSHKDINPNVQHFFNDEVPLHQASRGGFTEIVKLLLSHKDINPNIRAAKCGTPLHIALEKGQIEIAKLLLLHPNTDPNSNLQYTRDTPLHSACRTGQIEFIKLLLAHKHVDPNIKALDGVTPLHLALSKGHTEIARLLLLHKDMDPNPKMQCSTGYTPLHFALREGHIEIARLLLSHKAIDPNPRDNTGYTPLHEAARSGNSEAVGLFLEQRFADPNVQTTWGNTPLHYALTYDHIDVAKLLLAHDRLIIGQSSSGDFHKETVLEIAKRKGQTEIVEILESRGDIENTFSGYATPEYMELLQDDTAVDVNEFEGSVHDDLGFESVHDL